MKTLQQNKTNFALIEALKKISNFEWVGNTTHDTLEKCLTAINLSSTNSGWYNPEAVKINGLTGIFMLNENKSIFTEARIIKEDEKKFKIEYITNKGYYQLEELYEKYLNKQYNNHTFNH